MSETSEAEGDLYQGMRRRIRDWLAKKGKGFRYADVLLVGPDLLHLLSKLAIDPRVPAEEKAKIAAAIAYFVSPIDLLPEALMGPAGYIDDIAIAAYVLRSFVGAGHGDLAKEHFAGDEDLLQVIQRVLEIADGALGTGVWGRLKATIDGVQRSSPGSSKKPPGS
jgi:uncharacterized membrane protein YkvA (DUF1232 family)